MPTTLYHDKINLRMVVVVINPSSHVRVVFSVLRIRWEPLVIRQEGLIQFVGPTAEKLYLSDQSTNGYP